MEKSFDYEAAKQAGYNDEEIYSFLQKNNPSFDVSAAQQAGYSPSEINAFLSKNPPKQGGIRGQLERKVAGPATELALRAATSIPETTKGLGSLLTKGLNEAANAFGEKGLSNDQLNISNKLATALTPFGTVPNKEDIDQILKQATGGRLEPATPVERILKQGAGIVGDLVGFPGGVKAAFGSPARSLATSALAGTTAGLEESGAPGWLALTGGIGADILTRSGVGLGKKLAGSLKKGIPATTGDLAGKAAKLKPEQIRQDIIDAAERIGLTQGELPINAQVKSPLINGVETKLRESSLSGRHFSNQLENVEGKVRTAYEDIANNISRRQNLLPAAVSEEAITQLKDIDKAASEVYKSLYRQAAQHLPEAAVSEAALGKKILTHIEDQVEKLGRGAGTPAKDAIRNRLSRLSNDWKQRFSNGEIPVRELIELKRDLNDIIKYEVKGGVDKTLHPLLNMTKNAIENYGKTQNMGFLNRFNTAEKKFAKAANDFRKNKAVSSLLDTQNPQQILQKIQNVKTYRELKKIFESTPAGKDAFKDLSRYLLEDIIGGKLLNKNGQVSWGHASGMLKDPKKREIVSEIIGKENYSKLRDIQKISSGIEEGLKKFSNPSGSGTKALDVAAIVGTIGKGLGQIFTGRVIQGSRTMSYILLPRIMAKLMTNPEFIQSMVDVAHAGRGTNPKLFEEALNRASRFIVPAIAESYLTQNKEGNQENDSNN